MHSFPLYSSFALSKNRRAQLKVVFVYTVFFFFFLLVGVVVA